MLTCVEAGWSDGSALVTMFARAVSVLTRGCRVDITRCKAQQATGSDWQSRIACQRRAPAEGRNQASAAPHMEKIKTVLCVVCGVLWHPSTEKAKRRQHGVRIHHAAPTGLKPDTCRPTRSKALSLSSLYPHACYYSLEALHFRRCRPTCQGAKERKRNEIIRRSRRGPGHLPHANTCLGRSPDGSRSTRSTAAEIRAAGDRAWWRRARP